MCRPPVDRLEICRLRVLSRLYPVSNEIRCVSSQPAILGRSLLTHHLAIMTMDATSELLKSAATPQDLLVALKDLKNLVIGNTWKKVQVSEDEQVLQL